MGLSWYEPSRGTGRGGVFLGCGTGWWPCGGSLAELAGRRTGLLMSQVPMSARPEFET